ncbi:MAG TPA: FtsX-like permease family protein [Bryobacteraceae bacterium]|nr:FtsX-like permease family protein [Bryobacteraceae bacterium]
MGASQASVLRLVLRHSVSLLGWGISAGTILSLALAKPFRVILVAKDFHDPWSFGLAIVILVSVSIAAALLPAYRAIHVDPLRAVHYE